MGNTYECERIFKKSTNRYLRCVFCRPCVVPGPIYSHFVGFIGTGLISLSSFTFLGRATYGDHISKLGLPV